MKPRKTETILYFTDKKINVTESLAPDLISFSYDDKEGGELDEISVSLKDDKGKWAGRWKPDSGEIVRAKIKTEAGVLNCGTFYVDSMRSAFGSSSTFELRAVSAPLNTPIRRRLKTRSWEKLSLKTIAAGIAKEAELKCLYDSQENPKYDRQDQKGESDLTFLSRLCEESGFSLKVTDNKLVIYDQLSYEKKKPITTLTKGVSDILSADFEASVSNNYKSVTVSYRDPKQKKEGKAGSYNMNLEKEKKTTNAAVMEFTYTDPDADPNGQEYKLKKRATSIEEAERLAKAKMRQLNRRTVTGNMSIVGDVRLIAGVVVAIKGFGSFDGNFFIENAGHSVSSSGYVTSLSLRRVNTNY